MFNALIRGAALQPADQTGYRWAEAEPGQLVVRDVVRVRLDAYPDETGAFHNGRTGPIVAIRSGDVHVMYDDGGPKPADRRAALAAQAGEEDRMRTNIDFEVTGKDRAELERNALGMYRTLMGDEGAEIPFSATMAVTPRSQTISDDGTVTQIDWEANVSISLAASEIGAQQP